VIILVESNEAKEEKNQKVTAYSANTYLKKSDLIANAIITIIVLVLGLILIGMGLNENFYSESSSIRAVFNIITQFGGEMVYIMLFAVFFFAVSKKFSRKLLIGFLISVFFNNMFTEIFQDPRPSTNWPDGPSGEPIEEGYGFPSGHSQGGVTFYGFGLFYNKSGADGSKPNRIIQLVFIALVVLLPISRLILGVHDVQDVVGGFVIGMIILTIYLYLLPKFEELKSKSLSFRISVGFITSLVIWLITAIILGLTLGWSSAESIGQAGGLLMGCSIGFPLEEAKIGFFPEKMDGKQRIISLIVGLVLTIGGYVGLSAIFGIFTDYLWIWRCVRYFLLGIIVSLLGPILIVKLQC